MYIVELYCINGHYFEGWYDKEKCYYRAVKNNSLSCPMCDSYKIDRILPVLSHQGELPLNKFSLFSSLKPEKPTNTNTNQRETIEEKAIARIIRNIKKMKAREKKKFTKIEKKDES